MVRFLILALSIISLAGCAKPPPPLLWVRTDGRSAHDSPALEQQIGLDKTMCNGDAQKANLSAGTNPYGGIVPHAIEDSRRQGATNSVFEGCMASKGYALVPADNARAAAEEFAATKKEREKLAAQTPAR